MSESTNKIRRTYSNEHIAKAIQLLLSPTRSQQQNHANNITINSVSKEMDIAKSTLYRLHSPIKLQFANTSPKFSEILNAVCRQRENEKLQNINRDRRRYLSPAAEKVLVNWIVQQGKMYLPPNKTQIIRKAAELRSCFSQENDLPGNDWYSSFKIRSKDILKTKAPTSLSISRAVSATKENASLFFENVDKCVAANNLSSSDIIALDETGIHGERCARQTVLAERTSRNAYLLDSGFRLHTTIVHICVADGKTLPPIVILTGSSISVDSFDSCPDGTLITANKSGYLLKDHMIQVILHIIQCTPSHSIVDDNGNILSRKPIMLIYDGAPQHISISATELSRRNNINILILPPHMSHVLQVADVTIFGPFKRLLATQLNDWHFNNPIDDMTNDTILACIMPALSSASSEHNVRAGFLKCGIYPQDPIARSSILQSLPADKCIETNEFTLGEAKPILSCLDPLEENIVLKQHIKHLEDCLQQTVPSSSLLSISSEFTVLNRRKRLRKVSTGSYFLTADEAYKRMKEREEKDLKVLSQKLEKKAKKERRQFEKLQKKEEVLKRKAEKVGGKALAKKRAIITSNKENKEVNIL